MRGKRNLPVFIGYALISLVTLGYLATQMGGEFFMQGAYRVKAVFATGGQLVSNDDVTISGLRVGKVESLSPVDGGGAGASLIIHTQYAPLFKDARAVIKAKNLLGETYVEINRGSAASGPMPDGGSISRENTLTPVEIDRILDTLDQDTRSRLVLTINTLGQAVAGNGAAMNASAADLRQLAQALEKIASTVASSSGRLDALISGLMKVMQTLAAWHAEFRAMITDWDRLMRVLASREAALRGTLQHNDQVMAIFAQALSGPAAADLHQAIAEGPAALDHSDHYLADGQQVFPRLAQNSDSIAALFYELASVMSGIDPKTGQHMWRVTPVVDPKADASVPCNPYFQTCDAMGKLKTP
jgi:virulence factor Mce-like protein